MKLEFLAAAALPLALLAAGPVSAQNSSSEPPVVTPPPPAKTEPAPDTPSSTSPGSVDPVEPVPAPSTPVVVTPAPQRVPLEPVTIDPDAAYPEGFGDPVDPFSNDLATYREDEGGFDWGLLGLLGLLGLIPLFRNRGERIVYVERDEETRRAARRDPPPV